jgi:3'-phosphoadenosine 5'-phosphosulfate sulfotransferase (PAPS reductase)/FAD synthetase
MSKPPISNIISMSCGKDSTALALLAIERQTENMRFVFADTGHEHAQTYEYVQYLDGVFRERCGVGIDTVRADFAAQIERKRGLVATKWRDDGVPEAIVLQALDTLVPTGNPFLDLCLWKGRFPSTRARFCSQELKHNPLNDYMDDIGGTIISWQGVRRDESPARANLPERDVDFGSWEPEPVGRLIYRPILDWTAADVFAFHDRHGVKPNPLYMQGMGRVGCMPCIHARKAELREIASRFPAEIERVAEWERLVSLASKHGMATFRSAVGVENADVSLADHGIHAAVDWSNTARGGRQRDLIQMVEQQDAEAGMCSSIYGLCE